MAGRGHADHRRPRVLGSEPLGARDDPTPLPADHEDRALDAPPLVPPVLLLELGDRFRRELRVDRNAIRLGLRGEEGADAPGGAFVMSGPRLDHHETSDKRGMARGNEHGRVSTERLPDQHQSAAADQPNHVVDVFVSGAIGPQVRGLGRDLRLQAVPLGAPSREPMEEERVQQFLNTRQRALPATNLNVDSG